MVELSAPQDSRQWTRFSHFFRMVESEMIQRQERQIVQSRLNLDDSLPCWVPHVL